MVRDNGLGSLLFLVLAIGCPGPTAPARIPGDPPSLADDDSDDDDSADDDDQADDDAIDDDDQADDDATDDDDDQADPCPEGMALVDGTMPIRMLNIAVSCADPAVVRCTTRTPGAPLQRSGGRCARQRLWALSRIP